MDELVKTLGIHAVSKSQVSRMATDLDEQVTQFHHRSLTEAGPTWNTLLTDLTSRGLAGVRLVTSDAHAGVNDAIAANLPGTAWQRHRTHYVAKLMSVTPRSMWPPAAEKTDEWAEGLRYLGLDVLARSRMRLIPTIESEVNADTIMALST